MTKSKMISIEIDDEFLKEVEKVCNHAIKFEQRQEEIIKERCKEFLPESCGICKELLVLNLLGVKCKLAPNGDGRKSKRLPISCYPDCNKRADGCPLESMSDEDLSKL